MSFKIASIVPKDSVNNINNVNNVNNENNINNEKNQGDQGEVRIYFEIKPSKLEVAPNALKMLDGVGEWMDGYPLDCYDY